MKNLIPAFQKDNILLKDIENHKNTVDEGNPATGGKGVHIWWLGQSGFLISWQGKRLLFDPYLSDSLTKKYLTTNKPHTRMSERAIDPEILRGINIVTSSHNHTDHLDAETLIPLLKNNPNIDFIIPEANRVFVAERVQCALDFPLGMNDGDVLNLHDFKITCVPAAHNKIDRDEAGRLKYVGFVAQFGDFSVYHSGDTLWYDEIVDILKPFNLDVAFLPINGNDPNRGVVGNLNCEEAAELGKQIGAKIVIPHHYDMFEFNTANSNDFVKAATLRGQGFKVLKIGERVDF
jgi:L-ascorbate metabolism protein UlaG (beta-lactamase superfamily)